MTSSEMQPIPANITRASTMNCGTARTAVTKLSQVIGSSSWCVWPDSPWAGRALARRNRAATTATANRAAGR